VSFLTALYAAIKAVPIVDRWVTAFLDLYMQKSIENINAQHVEKIDKMRVILLKINECKTNEEKIILLSALSDIERV
jgi:hypothetical protein